MKNINVKRVVAGAAVLALGVSALGFAMAANTGGSNFGPIVKGDILSASGAPATTIVVGADAQMADMVWAGNIAGAIAKKTYTTVTTTTETPGEEGTETTVTGDGYLADNYVINAVATTKTLDDQDYSVLYKKDISADSTYAGASTLTIYDELAVTGKVYFNTDKDVKDLVASIDKGAITYTVDLDEGIKGTYTNAAASPRLKFNVMGRNYTVDSYDGTTLKLIQNIATQAYGVGDTFTSGDYTIEVVAIRDTGADTSRYEVELRLKDASGNVEATDVFKTGDTTIFDEFLDSSIDVDTVYSDSVKIIQGSSGKLELKNGDKIDDFPLTGNKLWKATLNQTGTGDTAVLTSFSLTTDDSSLRFTNDDSLKIGDKITLPLGLGDITFLGLTTEKTSEFSIKDNYINFTDADRKAHTVFMYDLDEATTARDTYSTPELDGHSLYFKFYTAGAAGDANFTVQLDDSDGKYLIDGIEGGTAATWGTTATYYSATGSTDLNADTVGIAYTLEIPLYKNEDRLVEYTLAVQPATSNTYNTVRTVAIGLTDNQTTDLYIGDTTYRWDVAGIDVSGTTTAAFTDGANFIGGRGVTTTDVLANDQFESIARINVYGGTSPIVDTYIYSYIDTYTGDMVNVSDNDFTDTYKQVDASSTDGTTTSTFDLSDEGNDTDLEFGYTTYGAKVSIEDGYPLMTLPEQERKGEIFMGNGTTTTTEGGTEGTETTTTTIVPANWDPTTLVKLDSAVIAGTKIIVGGHMVNTLAEGVTNSYLTQTGDYVMGKVANGNMIVAGYTAADTETAARQLITAINAM